MVCQDMDSSMDAREDRMSWKTLHSCNAWLAGRKCVAFVRPNRYSLLRDSVVAAVQVATKLSYCHILTLSQCDNHRTHFANKSNQAF